MEFYELHPVNPQIRYINKAVEILKNGGVIIYPTDTVYALGCDIYNKQALQRIHDIKNETGTKLYSFVCPNLRNISQFAKVSDYAYKTMKRLLPGPYTFVLPAAREVPKKLWTKRKSVGIRVPDHQITITLAEEMGNPIISTSVTYRTGEIIHDPYSIQSVFDNKVELMLSAGALTGKPSSIVDLCGDEPLVIREGAGDISLLY